MNHQLVVCAVLLLAAPAALQAADETVKKPNIVFIFTDDQPQTAMSCMGNRQILTPNIDCLAQEGVLFENSFVTTSICCVSRASLLTGQHMARHGIKSFDTPLSREQMALTYPGVLRSAGYRTAFLGKFAVGQPRVAAQELCLPAEEFDLWYGFPQALSFNQQGRYLTTVIEEKATQFIQEQPEDKPFLLIMALKEPHGPRDLEDEALPAVVAAGPIPRPKTLSAEAFEKLPAAIRQSRNSVTPGPTFLTDAATYQKDMAQAYRYINRADIAVGRIMKALEDNGFAENTVVIYSSDNGSLDGAHRLVGKWNMYEESIRVPLIIRDPRLPTGNRGRRSQMALNIDIAPTILGLAGVPAPQTMQGSDLQPILSDPNAKGRNEWYYEHDVELEGPGKPLPRCEGIRTERWKYIRYKDTNPLQEELFDLQSDPLEENNLATEAKHSVTLAQMSARCDELRKALK